MADDYYTLLTATGLARLAAAQAGGEPVTFAELAIGDGGGAMPDHDETSTALVGEVHRRAVNQVRVDPDNPAWVVVEATVPAGVGGWHVREVGLLDQSGDLVAVARYPETYKPVLDGGAGQELVIRLIFEIANAETVTLTVDPNLIMASRDYVDRAVRDAMPAGSIILWSGSLTAIPEGWALCDGEHGTPDLRDRFVVGAGGNEGPGATGGAATTTTSRAGRHDHGGTTGGRTLSVAQMPNHHHEMTVRAYNSAGNTEANQAYEDHLRLGGLSSYVTETGPTRTSSLGGGQSHDHPIGQDGDHEHTVETLPPYLALAWIMKVS